LRGSGRDWNGASSSSPSSFWAIGLQSATILGGGEKDVCAVWIRGEHVTEGIEVGKEPRSPKYVL